MCIISSFSTSLLPEILNRIPGTYSGDGNTYNTEQQRFYCTICSKSYLRKRHLQRHMRDECIGIPPRFNCEYCDSKFRRKYHLVRHMASKHGIQNIKPELNNTHENFSNENREIKPNVLPSNDKFSVDSLLMKQDQDEFLINNLNNPEFKVAQEYATTPLFQNLKSLFVNYALNNIPNQLQ